MGGSYTTPNYAGISSTEIRSACSLLRVRRSKWPRVVRGVQFMGQVVASVVNQRIGKKNRG